MVALCESMGANVTICFDGPGQPMLVEPHFKGAVVGDSLAGHMFPCFKGTPKSVDSGLWSVKSRRIRAQDDSRSQSSEHESVSGCPFEGDRNGLQSSPKTPKFT